jgi:allantoate deiminase
LAGSKALTGFIEAQEIECLRNEQGEGFDALARRFGLEPDGLASERLSPGDVHAMFELHIEQGAVLESEGLPVGIVGRIAGSENYRIRLSGQADHAGTTPMHLRRDALAGAAEAIRAIERIALEPERRETVATVGRIGCVPNSANVVPGHVEFSIDIRDIHEQAIASASAAIRDVLVGIAKRRGLLCEIELTGKSEPYGLSEKVAARLAVLAGHHGIAFRRMHSGALHDAAMMTRITDVGLIFVPSRDGRSHCPEESTAYSDIENGANLLLYAVAEFSGGCSSDP